MGNFWRVQFLRIVHLYHFTGLIFTDAHTHSHYAFYNQTYFAGPLNFVVGQSSENCKSWIPQKFPTIIYSSAVKWICLLLISEWYSNNMYKLAIYSEDHMLVPRYSKWCLPMNLLKTLRWLICQLFTKCTLNQNCRKMYYIYYCLPEVQFNYLTFTCAVFSFFLGWICSLYIHNTAHRYVQAYYGSWNECQLTLCLHGKPGDCSPILQCKLTERKSRHYQYTNKGFWWHIRFQGLAYYGWDFTHSLMSVLIAAELH